MNKRDGNVVQFFQFTDELIFFDNIPISLLHPGVRRCKMKNLIAIFLVIIAALLIYSATPCCPLAQAQDMVFAMDKHHCESVTTNINSFSELRNCAEGKGWTVKFIDVEPITRKYLQNQGVSVLCIQYVKLPYTEDEISEIVSFVENGGGLFIQADNPSKYYTKEILRKFGVKVTHESVEKDLTVTVSSDHPLLKDVQAVYLSAGYDWQRTLFLMVEPPATAIISAAETLPYKPVIAAAAVGRGRVVVYPNGFFTVLKMADNIYFMRNSLYWLERK